MLGEALGVWFPCYFGLVQCCQSRPMSRRFWLDENRTSTSASACTSARRRCGRLSSSERRVAEAEGDGRGRVADNVKDLTCDERVYRVSPGICEDWPRLPCLGCDTIPALW